MLSFSFLGGVWWNTDKKYKNAITNELYFALSSKLYLNTRDTRFLQAANAEWAWFNQSGMLNAQNLINDGLNLPSCTNNGGTTWTYNQVEIAGWKLNYCDTTGGSIQCLRLRVNLNSRSQYLGSRPVWSRESVLCDWE